jgi:hypothetical protein
MDDKEAIKKRKKERKRLAKKIVTESKLLKVVEDSFKRAHHFPARIPFLYCGNCSSRKIDQIYEEKQIKLVCRTCDSKVPLGPFRLTPPIWVDGKIFSDYIKMVQLLMKAPPFPILRTRAKKK